ncbi:sugar ABC transporter permease [Paenibacillus filicis]|uniref:Sugar ABC transporter permease n=1 Tax=Paenibacillus gyeongsangnamensis TaxID=3388067 RepID=A0ABT4QH58_9BACL|nr:sugar ABC transporter permease [Paenibacillus filicis]MCZ8516133.1 sugar ABC transporter permease [Paenibacillus filicis]
MQETSASLNKKVIKRTDASRMWKEIKRNWVPYVYISPFYILFAIFGAFPIFFALFLSFQQWDGLDDMRFIGMDNYTQLLSDPVFWKAMYNTFYILIIAHVPMLFLSLILAFIINSAMVKFKELFRAVYFLPVITSSVAVTIVFSTLFGVRAGLINYILTQFGLSPIDWWGGSGEWVKPAIILLFIWKWLGWNMVIYLAGLQGISKDYYEAASIDGASMIQIFRRITLPLLKPVIVFTLIQSTVGGLTIFDEPYMLVGTGGGTDNSGLTLMVYLYREAFEYVHFGYASSIAYVISAFIVFVAVLNMKFFGKSNT